MRYFDNDKTVELKNGQQLEIRRATAQDADEMLAYLHIVGGESDNLLFGAGEMTLTTEKTAADAKSACTDNIKAQSLDSQLITCA